MIGYPGFRYDPWIGMRGSDPSNPSINPTDGVLSSVGLRIPRAAIAWLNDGTTRRLESLANSGSQANAVNNDGRIAGVMYERFFFPPRVFGRPAICTDSPSLDSSPRRP